MSLAVRRVRLSALIAFAAAAGVLVASAPADAALKPITGKLSKRGYTVLAIDADGRATSVEARHGRFRLRPPARRVTLHLRDVDGVYAGPIVVARERKGARATFGVKPGARLGLVRIDARRGFAYARRTLSRRLRDVESWARARRGVPIGADNFGRVRSSAAHGPSHDADRDGVVSFLDVDDDGDLVLDKFERRTSSAAGAAAIDDQFLLHTNLPLSLHNTVNANAAGLTKPQLDSALAANGFLMMGIIPGDSPELDCGRPQLRTNVLLGGLGYCSKGGTGRFFSPVPGGAEMPRFPDDFDADGNGFGAMTPSNPTPAPGSGQQAMFLRHGATTSEIGTGDLLIHRVVQSGVQREYPATLQYVFATVPALVSYSDGQGNGLTIPYAQYLAGTDPSGPPGSGLNPYPVAAPPGGDVIVTLELWRPQREPIGNEQGPWIDIGGLNYTVNGGNSGAFCPQSSFLDADPPDSGIRPLLPADVFPAAYFGVKDSAKDKASSPRNTIRFKLNLSACAAVVGVPFGSGDMLPLTIGAIVPNGTDGAQQSVTFKRQ